MATYGPLVRVKEKSVSTGLGMFSFAETGTGIVGYLTFEASAFSDSTPHVVDYLIEAVDSSGALTGAWELGAGLFMHGGYTDGGSLRRCMVAASSNAGGKVDFAAGEKHVSFIAGKGAFGYPSTTTQSGTLYVDPTGGSDTAGDGSATAPLATLALAVELAATSQSTDEVMIQLQGNAGGQSELYFNAPEAKSIAISGNGYTIPPFFVASGFVSIYSAAFPTGVSDVPFITTYGGKLLTEGVTFPAITNAPHALIVEGVYLANSSTITGGAQAHIYAAAGRAVLGDTFTLSGTPAFSQSFVRVAPYDHRIGGVITGHAATFSGAATGQRYYAQGGGANIYVNGAGASKFPGSTAGAVANGGQYW